MNPHPADAPEPVLLIIADISGYTRYMTANAKTLAHSQVIITELIQTVVHQIELPLEVAKLEGDAVFLFSRKVRSLHPWPETRRIIGEKLLTFFSRFGEKLAELSRSTTCDCNACTHIERLRLKVIVHSGEALFHQVLHFTELAGVDVIIAHRLLKNSVNADQYLLLTESARADLELPATISLREGAETYEDIGQVNTLVYLPDGERSVQQPAAISYGERFDQSWKLFRKLWFAPFAGKTGSFRNISPGASAVRRVFFAGFTAILTPIFLPVGAVAVCFHAAKGQTKLQAAGICPEHGADCRGGH